MTSVFTDNKAAYDLCHRFTSAQNTKHIDRKLYKMLATHYRLWIYNGQDDGCIPYVGAQASHPWPSWLSTARILGP